jgi:hypothetical protein
VDATFFASCFLAFRGLGVGESVDCEDGDLAGVAGLAVVALGAVFLAFFFFALILVGGAALAGDEVGERADGVRQALDATAVEPDVVALGAVVFFFFAFALITATPALAVVACLSALFAFLAFGLVVATAAAAGGELVAGREALDAVVAVIFAFFLALAEGALAEPLLAF